LGHINLRIAIFEIDQNMDMSQSLAAVRRLFISKNKSRYPCLVPDIYLAISGASLTGDGESFLPKTVCYSTGVIFENNHEFPGISRLDNSGYGFEIPIPGFTSVYELTLAHELCHVLGANHYKDPPCYGNCPSTNCSIMCAQKCLNFTMDECSASQIKDILSNRCEQCFTEYTTPECLHCTRTGEIAVKEQSPIIPMCENRNKLTVTYTFTNDCTARTLNMRAPFRVDQIVIDGEELGGFNAETVTGDPLIHVLLGPNVSLAPEEKLEYTVNFILVDDPNFNNVFNNILLSFTMYDGNNVIMPTYIPENYSVFVSPITITGDHNLTQLLEPQNGWIFDSENISDCDLQNKAIRLDGILTINSNYCLNNTVVILEPGSKIIVEDGFSLTINKNKILGCEEMWDAIIVEEGGTLIVEDSKIEDGLNAIKLEANTEFSTENCEYINNNIAIQAELEEPGDIDFHVLGGNTIIADDVLPKEPLKGERAKAGIWLENVNFASIEGEPPHVSPGLNTIGNLLNGIMLKNTDASIKNFHIYDIKGDPTPYSLEDDEPSGHAIYINGSASSTAIAIGSSDTRDNYINGSETGIFARNAEVNIQYCNIQGGNSGIILGWNPRGESSITHNLINANRNGIQLRLPTTLDINISDNRFTLASGYSNGIQGLSSWGDVKIENNLFFLNESLNGINLLDCQNTQIFNNTIIYETPSQKSMRGISLQSSFNCKVVNNKLFGKDLDGHTVGIYVQDSPNNLLECNNSRYVNICNQFTGVSSMTHFIANKHQISDYGLLLGSEVLGSEAIIGNQRHHENSWPTQNYLTAGAWILTEEENIKFLSRFIVDASQNTFFPPNIGELTGWFIDEAHNDYEAECINFPLDPQNWECCNYTIPDTVISFDVNMPKKNYLLGRQLYSSILFSVIDTVDQIKLKTYYTLIDTTDQGKLSKARWNFIQAVSEDPNERNNYIAEALDFNSSIDGEEDYLTLEVESNILLAAYLENGDMQAFISMIESLQENSELCPYEYGPAVYINRSLLRGLDLSSQFDDANNCGEIEPRSNFAKEMEDKSIIIYPNPTNYELGFRVNSQNNISNISIYDITGRIIYQNINYSNNSLISTSKLNPGIYFIGINNLKTFKLIITE
jgi:hypothetical protein